MNWWTRLWHSCSFSVDGEIGDTWLCPECKRWWRYDRWHIEDLVAIDTASMVDIGEDVEGWR